MGKSSRSSAIKKNNQALKKKVFGPVETARIERQNAKLLALAKAPKELVMEDSKTNQEPPVETAKENETSSTKDTTTMDVDDEDAKPKRSKREIARMQEARKVRAVAKLRGSRSRPRNQKEFPAHKLKKKVHKR
ncbi:hypothetical protein CERZMDRAFT_97982 [Cercospora zeae-maydis SCOH1-5]|uniref:DUF2423 domain-containing protein n=1 Tax=Cercospora zeae-maydis SCOH1-5 TaxID=717836 RepID=A0A6A6FF67_9PEZI|nr:hypothetical protein CERZMDRAFT_97982 [Cercospora zeae-maydis SCOH1-5]